MLHNHEIKKAPHPKAIDNRMRKTQSNIGDMLKEIVRNNPNVSQIEVPGIVDLMVTYRISNKTFTKYLRRSIFQKEGAKHNQKVLYLSSNDILIIKEFMWLENRYNRLDRKEKDLVRLLIENL